MLAAGARLLLQIGVSSGTEILGAEYLFAGSPDSLLGFPSCDLFGSRIEAGNALLEVHGVDTVGHAFEYGLGNYALNIYSVSGQRLIHEQGRLLGR